MPVRWDIGWDSKVGSSRSDRKYGLRKVSLTRLAMLCMSIQDLLLLLSGDFYVPIPNTGVIIPLFPGQSLIWDSGAVRGHFFQPFSLMEYFCPTTPDTFHLCNTSNIPPHHW